MSNRLTALVRAYAARPETDLDQTLWRFAVKKDPYLFSHHPPGAAFREHVWEIGGLYFCKGCVVTFGGFLFGAGLAAGTGWLHRLSDLQVGGIFVLLLLPTVVVHLGRLPRWCRHLARFALGGLIASAAFMLFATESWLVRLVIIAVYFAAKVPLERLRERENRSLAKQCGCGDKANLKPPYASGE